MAHSNPEAEVSKASTKSGLIVMIFYIFITYHTRFHLHNRQKWLMCVCKGIAGLFTEMATLRWSCPAGKNLVFCVNSVLKAVFNPVRPKEIIVASFRDILFI